jgi:hypothetical protein
MTYDEVAQLIEENRYITVDFGTSDCEIIPSQERIEETEKRLQAKLPPSYIWFLKNYGGGTVFGDDIYAVSKSYSESDMFDVASKTIADRGQGFINENEIAICTTDFGEQFVMDTLKVSDEGEYPVVRKMGDVRKQVADSFVDFLGRYIGEQIT